MITARKFIPWDKVFLKECASAVLEQADWSANGKLADLSRFTCVFPARRSLRSFTHHLISSAEARGALLQLPKILTLGALPEELVPKSDMIVEGALSRLLWVSALKQSPENELEVLYRNTSRPQSLSAWHALAEFCSNFVSETALGAIDIRNVDEGVLDTFGEEEAERWRVLQSIANRYSELLCEKGLLDKQFHRLSSLAHGEVSSNQEILLLGTVDVSPLVEKLLESFAGKGQSFIFAPREFEEYFDTFGGLSQALWAKHQVELSDDSLFVGSDPESCVNQLIVELSELSDRFEPAQVVVALADDQDYGVVTQRLEEFSIPFDSGIGEPVTQNSLYRLLLGVSDVVRDNNFYDFLSLLRHPWIVSRLSQSLEFEGDETQLMALLLDEADSYQSRYLQFKLSAGLNKSTETLLNAAVNNVTDDLKHFGDAALELSQWFERLFDYLNLFVAEREVGEASAQCFEQLQLLRERLVLQGSSVSFPCSGSDFLWLIIQSLNESRLEVGDGAGDGVLVAGWLEPLFSSADAVFVLGAEEGLLPQTESADVILPDSTKTALGIPNNERRFARDLYVLQALLKSKSKLKFLFSKFNLGGEPALPSRLLYQTTDGDFAKRVATLFGQEGVKHAPVVSSAIDVSSIVLHPPADVGDPVSTISVTSFKDYIRCPYRYFLKHVKKAYVLDDSWQEVQAHDFGSILHALLDDFGGSEVKSSSNQKEIFTFLDARLTARWDYRYPENTFPAVKVQKQQMRERLEVFSAWQANWRAKGWEITHTELDISKYNVALETSEGPVKISGRIDRVDHNPKTGEWVVADYKTADNPYTPNQTHRYDGGWVDLQLPLYRELIKRCGIAENATPMYILLPANPDKTKEATVKWDDEDFAEALEIAHETAALILQQKYWPPSELPFGYDDFAAHCGVGQKAVEIEL